MIRGWRRPAGQGQVDQLSFDRLACRSRVGGISVTARFVTNWFVDRIIWTFAVIIRTSGGAGSDDRHPNYPRGVPDPRGRAADSRCDSGSRRAGLQSGDVKPGRLTTASDNQLGVGHFGGAVGKRHFDGRLERTPEHVAASGCNKFALTDCQGQVYCPWSLTLELIGSGHFDLAGGGDPGVGRHTEARGRVE